MGWRYRTRMNIDKALNHFEWKFKNHWKPTEKDVEAINSIIEYREHQDSVNLQKNESLAKLWIDKLMTLNDTNMYSAERAIQVIDEVLDNSVYHQCKKLHKNIGNMQINVLLKEELGYLEALKSGNITKLDEINEKIVKEQPEKLLKFLKNDVKEDNIIKFVEKHITRIIKKYEK